MTVRRGVLNQTNLGLLASVIRARAELRSHERWSRDELLAYQARKLDELRRFAVERSPFYRELHRGLEGAPLDALPVVTKQDVMQRFDEFVTDPEIRLRDVEAYLAHASATDTFRGRYRVAATGGTTGRRGFFLADPIEWRTVLASYSRAYDWAGIHAGLTNRVRMAVVSSLNPSHQSAMVAATVASPFIPTLRLDASTPTANLIRALNEFRPEALVGYASILGTLAAERRARRLVIEPRAIMSASEVLTDDLRARIRDAFGVAATNVYAATEPAGIASECRFGRLHRYEDLVIAEIVDDENRAVPPGVVGSKMLVTVLSSRTQPLIRYELSDRVEAIEGTCPDGLPFALLGRIEGRKEEVLQLGGVAVHPNVFHNALERFDLGGWQVVDEGGRLRVLLVRSAQTPEIGEVMSAISRALAFAGAPDVPVSVEIVDSVPRTALGKAPLIRRERSRGGPMSPADHRQGE